MTIPAACGLVVAFMVIMPGQCTAGIIVGTTVPDRPEPATMPQPPTVPAKSKSSPPVRTPQTNPATIDRAGISPIDLTRRNPSSSVFAVPESGESSTGILGLCVEMTRQPQSGEANLQRFLMSTDPLSALEPMVPRFDGNTMTYGGTEWSSPQNSLLGSVGSLPAWQGDDALQVPLISLDMRGGASGDPLASALAGLGIIAAPSMMSASFGGGSGNGPAGDSSDGPRYHFVAESHARGVSGGVSSTSGSTGEQATPESAGNLLWFLAAALGVYPILRGRTGSRAS